MFFFLFFVFFKLFCAFYLFWILRIIIKWLVHINLLNLNSLETFPPFFFLNDFQYFQGWINFTDIVRSLNNKTILRLWQRFLSFRLKTGSSKSTENFPGETRRKGSTSWSAASFPKMTSRLDSSEDNSAAGRSGRRSRQLTASQTSSTRSGSTRSWARVK